MPSRKKIKAEVETIEPDPKTTRRAVVAAKHTVTYEAPEVVEIPIEDDEDEDGDSPQIEFAEPERQPRQPSFRTKIRDRFKARGIGVDERLVLRIDRLPFFEQNGFAGVKADKEFCGVIPCVESFFDGEEYLTEILRRYGPGEYWLTLRHKNAVVSSWRERIGGFPVAPIITQSSEPGQPPQVIYQQPMGQAPPPRAFKEELKDVAEMMKLFDSIRGPRDDNPQTIPRTDDEVLATAILKQPDVVENVVGNVIKRFGRSGGDDDPSPWSVAMKLVESGQAAQIVKTLIDSFFSGVNGMLPGRQNNGTTTMVQAPHALHGNAQNPAQQNGQAGQHGQGLPVQALPPSAENPSQAGAPALQVSPEQEALSLVIHHCKNKVPPKITFAELSQREQRLDFLLNQHAMQTGQVLTNQIALYLDIVADMSSDDALTFIKTIPDGPEVAALPHAKEWTEQLQALIRDSQEGDGDA